MRKLLVVAFVAFAAAFVGNWLSSEVQAQTVVPPITIIAPALTHTSCNVTPAATSYCFASDGLWQSLNGAAYTQLGVAVGGVTSVNGKTGAVVISASTTLN